MTAGRSGPRRIALTGGIATGKSHVRAEFERLGVPTIDSDVLAREAVRPGSAGLAAVVERFGRDIVDAAGHLDRARLASIVFSDASARRDLEDIVHPIVREQTETWLASLDPAASPLAIADIPLLFETGRDRDFDAVIVAACSPETQLARLMARDGLEELAARRRIAAQWPIADKVARADYVVSTEGSIADTRTRVRAVYEQLTGGAGA